MVPSVEAKYDFLPRVSDLPGKCQFRRRKLEANRRKMGSDFGAKGTRKNNITSINQ
jgi:hypothetical protein